MDSILGPNNTLTSYLVVLLGYAALFEIIRTIHPRIDPDYKRKFIALYIGWAPTTFIANYLLYRVGVMSFLPWLNDFFHTFIWIGLCLGFLYGAVQHKSMLDQFALFAIFSFIVKWGEYTVLGTWELNHFFMIKGHVAYLLGWSLADGLYPVLSFYGLTLLGRYIVGLQPVTPVFATERM